MSKMQKAKLFLLFISFLFVSNFSSAQIWKDVLKLDFSFEKVDECTGFVIVKAKPLQDYHIFSVNHDPEKADFTGAPSKISTTANKKLSLVGKMTESLKPTVHNDEFGLSLYFEKPVVFKQKVSILSKDNFDITFMFEGQVCHDLKGCIPVEREFTLNFKDFKLCKVTENIEKATETLKTDEPTSTNEVVPEDVKVEENKQIDSVKTDAAVVISKETPKEEEKTSFWYIFIAGFGGGLIALLTPCVFPMIPMTVTFFTKQSGSRRKGITNALLYGLSIVVIYVIIGLVITAAFGVGGLNQLSTNVWMNLFFFAIFMIFAFSFLGAFEIRMPSSWVNKADGQADKGGLIGIFFMAFTLSLVSFSCTGPIIGTLLVESAQSGNLMGPAIGMVGFSSALAIPFTLFAIFPGWLNSLPQSGGWLNSVKVVLGMLELALAMKFLSGIDLAYHWGILTREVFVAIWIVIFFLIGIYLLGKLRFSHDSPVERLSVTRFMFAVLSLVFAVYLLPGMWGAPLRLIDGVAPPRNHSEDNFRFVRGESGGGSTVQMDPLFNEYKKDMHEIDGDLFVFHDLDKAKEYAAKVNKPILLDFTGYNCPNCRRTESTVWTNPAIHSILKNDVVIASLYTDDKAELPKSEWKYSEVLEAEMRTYGNKWQDYQVRHYKKISQPLYILIDNEGNDLTETLGYEPNIQLYLKFLTDGLAKYQK